MRGNDERQTNRYRRGGMSDSDKLTEMFNRYVKAETERDKLKAENEKAASVSVDTAETATARIRGSAARTSYSQLEPRRPAT